MNPILSRPSVDDLRGFLLGTLPPSDADRVAAWVEADPTAADALANISAGDTLTDALAAPTTVDAPAAAAVDRIIAAVVSTLGTEDSSTPLFGLPVPARVGSYTLVRELGRGGMGVVYEARDQNLNRTVALKMVLGGAVAGPAARARFLAEAEALAALHHPHVVQVFDRGEYQGLPYFTMEFCPAGSLAARVQDNPLPPRAAAEVTAQLARGVAAAHAVGILHRDLKPENVLFAADGTPKITDFGLAKRFADSGDAATGLTYTGAQMGTPSYMAPEQARGESKRTGPATDVYGLGALLYRLVTGRPPFLGANSTETMRQVVDDDPVSPTALTPGLPRDLATICLKCLAKDPAKRYATADDLAADLRRYLDGHTIVARRTGVVERGWKWVRRHRSAATAAAITFVALLTATTVSTTFAVRAAEAARRESAMSNEFQAQKILLLVVTSRLTDPNWTLEDRRAFKRQFLIDHPGVTEEAFNAAFDPMSIRDPARVPEAGTLAAAALNPNLFGD